MIISYEFLYWYHDYEIDITLKDICEYAKIPMTDEIKKLFDEFPDMQQDYIEENEDFIEYIKYREKRNAESEFLEDLSESDYHYYITERERDY